MVRYLSPEWMAAFAAALGDIRTDDTVVVEQRIAGAPEGDVVFHVSLGPEGGRVDTGNAAAPTIAFDQDYRTACAIAAGELSAEEAFIRGRMKLEGEPLALIEHRRALARLGDVFADLRAATSF